MQRECKISVHEDREFVTIDVQGDLTAIAEEAMGAAYQKACDYSPEKVLLKFDGRSRINSAGIALVINLVIESQERGCKVFITGVSRHFRKIFELVGLTKYTSIVGSEEEVTAS